MRYEMASCVGDEFGDVQKQSRDLILIRITCESCENEIELLNDLMVRR